MGTSASGVDGVELRSRDARKLAHDFNTQNDKFASAAKPAMHICTELDGGGRAGSGRISRVSSCECSFCVGVSWLASS